jgi:hypothetical protein
VIPLTGHLESPPILLADSFAGAAAQLTVDIDRSQASSVVISHRNGTWDMTAETIAWSPWIRAGGEHLEINALPKVLQWRLEVVPRMDMYPVVRGAKLEKSAAKSSAGTVKSNQKKPAKK